MLDEEFGGLRLGDCGHDVNHWSWHYGRIKQYLYLSCATCKRIVDAEYHRHIYDRLKSEGMELPPIPVQIPPSELPGPFLVITILEGSVEYVSLCGTMKGAEMSRRYGEKLWEGKAQIRILDCKLLQELPDANERAQIAALERMMWGAHQSSGNMDSDGG